MDLTKYFIEAELLGSYKENEFSNILTIIQSLYNNFDFLSYEPDAEDWAIISDKKGNLIMIHTKIKIILTNIKMLFQLPIKFVIIHFVNYNDKIWSIDLNALKHSGSNLYWHTQLIDTSYFSTQDLYYATL